MQKEQRCLKCNKPLTGKHFKHYHYRCVPSDLYWIFYQFIEQNLTKEEVIIRELQKYYCRTNGLPYFLDDAGLCSRCKRQVFAKKRGED